MHKPQITDAALGEDLRAQIPLLWLNNAYEPQSQPAEPQLDPERAMALFERCAALMARLFPELAASGGRLGSPLQEIPKMQQAMLAARREPRFAPGKWLIKRDDSLPVAGSVKARGGFHEALAFAERVARAAGLLAPDASLAAIDPKELQALLGRYTLSVGSTGNLGLAIGMIGTGLGFRSQVHMSADAKEWKKARLRRHGIQVVEHAGDYAAAVEAGRALAAGDPQIHFVDDEQSPELFTGYAAAATELKAQLDAQGIRVSPERPLFVYLPCGVGGAPGGIVYGLKKLFGAAVHCFFAEPVAAPCMLVQLAAGSATPISVYDIGLDNRTEADGLAVASASPLVAPIMARLLAGVFTVADASLFQDARALEQSENIYIEPSAAAGLRGPLWLLDSPAGQDYLQRHGLPNHLAAATHVIWSTGGSLVPEEIRAQFRARGR